MEPADLLHFLVRALGALILVIINSVIVAVSEHPEGDTTLWARVLAVLSRASLLRFANSPGTLHLPGRRQPEPRLDVASWARERNYELRRLPDGGPPMPPPPHQPPPVVLLVFFTLAALACTPGLAQTQRQVAGALDKQRTALTQFRSWDAQHQLELVRGAKSRQEAQARLKGYRDDRASFLKLVKDGAAELNAAADTLQRIGSPQ